MEDERGPKTNLGALRRAARAPRTTVGGDKFIFAANLSPSRKSGLDSASSFSRLGACSDRLAMWEEERRLRLSGVTTRKAPGRKSRAGTRTRAGWPTLASGSRAHSLAGVLGRKKGRSQPRGPKDAVCGAFEDAPH